jgi:DNA mismatch repair protein MutS2
MQTSIDHLFRSITANRSLSREYESILMRGRAVDTASPELSDIRRHMRIANTKIKDVLNHIITSQTYQKILQEPIVTMAFGALCGPCAGRPEERDAGAAA